MRSSTYLSLLFFLFLTYSALGQDYYFNQFDRVPNLLNPSLAGNTCGGQLLINYRHANFGVGTFNESFQIAYDMPFELKNGDKIGLGAMYFYDESKSTSLERIEQKINAVYRKVLFKTSQNSHYLNLGIQLGFTDQYIESNFQWGTQHNGNGGVNTQLPSLEPELNSDKYFDLSSGFSYLFEGANRTRIEGGIAVYHINQPTISLLMTQEDLINLRMVSHITVDIPFTSSLVFRVKSMNNAQGPASVFYAGGDLLFYLPQKEDQAFLVGWNGQFVFDNPEDQLTASHISIGFQARVLNIYVGIEKFHYLNFRKGMNAIEAGLRYRFCKKV